MESKPNDGTAVGLQPQESSSAMGGAMIGDDSPIGYMTAMRLRSARPVETLELVLLSTLLLQSRYAMRLHQRVAELETTLAAMTGTNRLPDGMVIANANKEVLAGNGATESTALIPPQEAGTDSLPVAEFFTSYKGGSPKTNRELIQRAFSMTDAEARIAVALARGGSVKEIASRLGVTHHTIRTHLKRLFSKTGTRRQGELISLLLTNSNPVRAQG